MENFYYNGSKQIDLVKAKDIYSDERLKNFTNLMQEIFGKYFEDINAGEYISKSGDVIFEVEISKDYFDYFKDELEASNWQDSEYIDGEFEETGGYQVENLPADSEIGDIIEDTALDILSVNDDKLGSLKLVTAEVYSDVNVDYDESNDTFRGTIFGNYIMYFVGGQ